MKRLLVILLTVCAIFSFSACDRDGDTTPPPAAPAYTTSLPQAEGVTNFVQFTMDNGATFVVELYPDEAPITVANFKTLVAKGFYNGLTFHRIDKNFMVQGGDSDGDGLPSDDQQSIKGEFSANGVDNPISHKRGVISMARLGNDMNSAYSQFFIMCVDKTRLDGNYAAFGRVVAGMETIDELANLAVTEQKYSSEKTRPVTPPVMTSVYFVNFEK